MKRLTHENLTVYQRTIEFVSWSAKLIEAQKITGSLLDQFKRAFISIALNIAEGCGKQTGRDQAKFYDIARGSALECGACLDVLVALKGATEEDISTGKDLLVEVVSMLASLAASRDSSRVNEEESNEYTNSKNPET